MKRNLMLILILAISLTAIVFAGGTDTRLKSNSKTVSLNGLYFAGSDGIIKSFLNPAGLIYLKESGLEFTLLDCLAQNSFESSSGELYNSLREDEFSFSGGFLWSVSDELKTSFSYQEAVGYKSSWPYAQYYQQDSLNALLVFDLYNDLKVDAISASISYRFGNIVFGLSPVLYHITNKVAFSQDNQMWTAGVGAAAYQFEYDEDAWTYGFNLGAIGELSDEFKVGLSVRSSYSADLEGTAKSKMFAVTDSTDETTTVTSNFEMPWIIGIGSVYSVTSNIFLNIDIQYSLWGSTAASINHKFANQIWQDNLSSTDPGSGINGGTFNLNYNNTLDLGVGFEYISEGLISYRLGYLYSQSPNSDETYSFLFPAVDTHTMSLGIGLREGNLLFDASLAYTIGIEKSVSNGAVEILDGAYNYDSIVPMVTLKYIIF
jgi:long-subunit fatty acid transport protein